MTTTLASGTIKGDAAAQSVSELHTTIETIASNPKHVELAQRLRFEVFNLEMNEGLATSAADGRDADPFDAVCDHLFIWDKDKLVGTYRTQPGLRAKQCLGYYGEQEFDFGPLEHVRGQMIELGRACVHIDYRNLNVIGVLWKAIADYATLHGARYCCGCSSLTSQSPAEGASAYKRLTPEHLAPPEFQTMPMAKYAFSLEQPEVDVKIPKLLRAYIGVGAKICGPPALDTEFKTIDFLTVLDLDKIPPNVRKRYFGK